MKYAKLIGTGSYLPEKVLTNSDLEKLVDTSDEWIVERTGIRERHIVAEGESVASMAEQASRAALSNANISPEALDLIIVATCTPNNFFPSTACLLQSQLKAKNSFAFDVNAACSGFIYALSVADNYIRTNSVKNVLVVGSEALSRITDWTDRNTCVLFGDGAGAVVLQASQEPGIIANKLYANGDLKDLLYMSSGIYEESMEKRYLHMMEGRKVFKIAVGSMANAAKTLLLEQEMTISDIDWLIPHQANVRIIDAIVSRLNIPSDHVVRTVDKHANTAGASIPLALDYAMSQGLIQHGQNVLLEAFGAGLTWGTLLLRY